MSGVNTNGHWKEHRDFGFIVLAGALIGIGAGMFVDYTFSGFLIGLGLGFVASGLIPLVWRPSEGEGLHQQVKNVTLLLIGAFPFLGRLIEVPYYYSIKPERLSLWTVAYHLFPKNLYC